MNSVSESYAAAGVDVTAGYKAVEFIKSHVAKTAIPGVISGIGGFGGMFEPDLSGIKRPVLVSGTDGVGTKLKLAFMMDKHDTIGIDCVAMCVNDVACSGAQPMFFLDYIACGKNYPEKIASIVSGVAEGCLQAGCALIGGETAEMPGFYPEDEYDLAGFCVGVADYDNIISGNKVAANDVLIGVASSGVHSNGFSLVRKVFGVSEKKLSVYCDDLGCTLGESLLTPTKIYVKSLLNLIKNIEVHGISHITGGGFYENIPRMLPDGLKAVIKQSDVPVLPVFHLIQQMGSIPERDMFNTFNMGIGLCIAVPSNKADEAVRLLNQSGEKAGILGHIETGEKGVELC
ncbi:MAG TPA: phosphoribosylformylglycinamidine cyclo-ligase [Ruminococcaceae bacterium]|nr:phosphoribosylformylglycinamidine cyclo-ligase [Oscillospiraceae bacterium]HCA30130.1 phosphoribosylformylglycinamidine cyclo-ligase [Oscillospiraceae bacterium]